MTPELSKFEKMLAQRRALEAENKLTESKPVLGLEDAMEKGHEIHDPDPFVRFVKNLPVSTAMDMLTYKEPKPKAYRKTDGVMFRCPHFDHEDKIPSAALNTVKKEWTCYACGTGGDWLELAAANWGYRTSMGWNDKKRDWPEFIERLKLLLGYSEPEPEPYKVEKKASKADLVAPAAKKKHSGSEFCAIPWQKIVPEGTFLSHWMNAVTTDDAPEEFHFASGLLALGMALGRDVTLQDGPPVHGNLFVCLLGDSGSGKSKSSKYLRDLLAEALPYNTKDALNKGVKMLTSPASGEVLYKMFNREVEVDTGAGTPVVEYLSVRGLIDYPELSGMVSRAGRSASTVKPTLIELYDNPGLFSTESLTRGALMAKDPFASLLTTTQPGVLQELMTKSDDKSGFMNRIIFITGTVKPLFSINKNKVDLIAPTVSLRNIFNWTQSEMVELGKYQIEWSEEAELLWSNFFRSRVLKDRVESQNDLLKRMDLFMKKLILLFTANRMLDTVPVESVQDAIECYDYFIGTYSEAHVELGKTSLGEREEKVLSKMRDFLTKLEKEEIDPSDWPTARDLQQLMFPKPPAKELHETLQSLVSIGVVQEFKPALKKAGRPTVRFAPA